MINIQDLKIGNILQRIDMQGKLSPCVVMQIGKKSFGVLQDGLNYGILDLKECSPIPLTEKILLDSGFESIDLGGKPYFNYNLPKEQLGKGSFTPTFQVEMSISGLFRFAYCLKEIPCHSTEFVHDIQNAYYQATRENLTIVIK